MEVEVTRVYHPWNRWEDYPAGFYEKPSGAVKKQMIDRVIELFSSADLTTQHMSMVIEKWPFSCEHNFTNNSLNRIAYLGQAACCIYAGIPSTVTMEAWSSVPEDKQKQACDIAESLIVSWLKTHNHAQA